MLRLREHQSAAARQPFADECRTLLRLSRYGVLSTLSVAKESEGFPNGSIVGFADDASSGAPIFCFSTMSGHTRDVLADGRASLTVTAPGFEGAADARVCLTGRLTRVPEAQLSAVRERYMAVHPDAFWATFGGALRCASRHVTPLRTPATLISSSCETSSFYSDFSFFIMNEIVAIRLVGGFARAGSVPPHLYAAAAPDPVASACGPAIAYANAHGEAAWAAVVRTQVGGDVRVDSARVASLDRLGLNLMARKGQDSFKLRMPFPAPADTPAAVQAAIESMLATAARG